VNTIKRTEKTITPRQAILRAAVEKYGSGAQQMKAIEELSELIRSLARADDPENIAEEMADVEIMLAQLRIILGNDTDVERWKVKKLQRLNRRLHAAEVVE
jgi:NTP pyrophosphatase (non-canonical NTP hydrolase)